MGEVKLNIDDSMRILNNPDAGSDARVIAGCAMAFFEVTKSGGDYSPETRAIAQRLLRMTAARIDDDFEDGAGA